MALVAYENSDSSEFEDDDEETVVVALHKKVEVSDTAPKPEPSVPNLENGDEIEEERNRSPHLFNLLPQPSTKTMAVVEDDDEFLKKKETVADVKPKARITVPSLSDFKDVDDKPIKPKVASVKKSGLLSILPQPRNAVTKTTKSLIPHILTQKPSAPTAKKKVPLPSPMKKTKTEPKDLVTSYSDDSDDEEVHNDFFSINKPIDIPVEDTPLDIDTPVTKNEIHVELSDSDRKIAKIQSYFKKDVVQNHVELEPDYKMAVNGDVTEYGSGNDPGSSEHNSYQEQASSYESNDVSNNEVALDEEAIMKLCGSRGKRKREEIQIVDVNQKDVLGDSREWLLKGLMDDTSKRVSSSKRRGNEPTSQQKRKHQITYLAHQAKANEAELQNQWANNRMSKRQTQSKYGF